MKQILHVLVIDREHGRVLTAMHRSKWLLPILTCNERTRALPSVTRWLFECGIRGDVAGQWLGRVQPDSIDWLVAIAAAPGRTAAAGILQWHFADVLASSPAVLEYQQWALARTLASGPWPSVMGPFGDLSWPQAVRAWIAAAVGGVPVASLMPFRCAAHEVVVGANCGSTHVYFKGLTAERASEVHTTCALAAIEPDSFARTIATTRRPDGTVWWLTGECAGKPGRSLPCMAQALARIQRRVIGMPPVHVACPRLPFERMARWAATLLGDSPGSEAIGRASTRLRLAGTPATWIPMDLDAANVLVDESGRARFIDVDDSFLGPAPLAMSTLAMRCRDRALYYSYERMWRDALAGLDWPTVETAASVIHAWLGWHRLERNVARGEVLVDATLAWARTRARLSRTIDAHSPLPAIQAGPAA